MANFEVTDQLPECDFCESTESIKRIGNSNACPLHVKDAEPKAKTVDLTPIGTSEVIRNSRQADANLAVRTDIHNAETLSIAQLYEAVDKDAAIVAKPFAKAQLIQERINTFRKLQFEMNEKIVEVNNRLRVDLQALNTLANHLRADEREILKIQHVGYNPRPVKMPVTAKSLKLTKKRIGKEGQNDIKRAAKESGIPAFSIQAYITMKQCTVAEAITAIKANLAAAMAQATAQTTAKTE
jgi:hypothetical protein